MKRMTEEKALLLLAWADGMEKDKHFNYEDPSTYELLQKADTDGIFFMESRYDRYNLRLLKPSCFNELVAACAFTHPLTAEGIYYYLRNKALNETDRYGIPEISDLLKDTNGIFLYKEQAQEIKEALEKLLTQGHEELRPQITYILRDIEKISYRLVNRRYITRRAQLVYKLAYVKAHNLEKFHEIYGKLCQDNT